MGDGVDGGLREMKINVCFYASMELVYDKAL